MASEAPVPSPAAGEVLVLVMAAGIAFAPGDASGVVWRVGEGVSRWKAGDEVVVSPSVSCGACAACTGFGRGACERPSVWAGGLSELAIANAEQLLRKPRKLSWEDAGSYASAYFGAYRALVDRAKVRPGDAVLVWDGERPLGGFAVELARLLGAVVASVGLGPRKDRARRLESELAVALGTRAPDVVLVGADDETLSISVRIAARRARIVLAAGSGSVAIDTAILRGAEKSILGVSLPPADECQRANELVHQEKIVVPAARVYPFDEVAIAMRAETRGEHRGSAACLVAAPRPGLTSWAEALAAMAMT